jgi:hypothetical protein
MLNGLIAFAAGAAEGAGHAEPSKTAFYLLGGLLAVYAVLISAAAIRARTFPSSKAQRGAVMALSAVLVVAALAASVATG